MFIIEFCGLPGTGKSTLCYALEKQCKKNGFNVKNLQWRPLVYNRKQRQINKIELLFDSDCRKIDRIFRKCSFKNIDKDNLYWLLRIKQNVHIVNQYRKNKLQIATFDEGCVQFVSSLFHGKEMDEKECEFAERVFNIAYSGYDRILFDCRLDIEENVNRIQCRNRPGDRFMADNIDEIKRRLDIKRDNLDKCISRYGKTNVKEIDMQDFQVASEETIRITEDLLQRV